MRRVILLAFTAMLFLAAPCAFASTVYDLRGTLQDGTGQFNGTITYNPQFGSFHVAGTVTDGSYSFTVPTVYFGETIQETTVEVVDVFSLNANYDLSLYLPLGLISDGMGGALCALSTPCGSIVSHFSDYDLSGSPIYSTESFQTLVATPQATPEPDSLLLLGTGVTAMMAAVRRRLSSVA